MAKEYYTAEEIGLHYIGCDEEQCPLCIARFYRIKDGK